MFSHLTLDIETIPAQRADVLAHFSHQASQDTAHKINGIRAPGNYKDEAKIAEYVEQAKKTIIDSEQTALAEAVRKTSLSGAFGQVVCIGVAQGQDEPQVLSGLNERELLLAFTEWLDHIPRASWLDTTVIGHNCANFDLRFLLQRHIVNQVRPHTIIKRAASAKPWESEKVYDTMVQFAGIGQYISLDKLCLALGLPGKGDITGADVWPMVQAGRLDEVADYCKSDVSTTRAVFQRMTFEAVHVQ
ncbi:MAG: hypothetical protein WBI20_14990 [Burkholderiaceae bacterium]